MSETSLATFSDALADLAAATAPSVVEVSSPGSLASGFFWRERLIVTADETLADSGEIEVELSDGSVHQAVLVGRDPSTDIALLQVEGTIAPPIAFGVARPRAGSLALAIGAANSTSLVALGAVAAVEGSWRSMRGGAISARIELDLRLRARSQGGVAIGMDGSAIGMAVLGPRRRALVIPADTIERVASLLLEHGRIPRGYLGLGLREVAVGKGEIGAMIMVVDADGPASAAGVHQGDVIVQWAGAPIESVGRLLRALEADSVGTSVVLGVRRAGQQIEATIVIGDRPR